MMRFSRIFSALDPAWQLHWGMTPQADGRWLWVLAARHRRIPQRRHLIAQGRDAARLVNWLQPLCAHLSLDDVPVDLVCDELQGIAAEVWVDRNEERLLPRGMKTEQVQSEWAVVDDRIFAATVNRQCAEQYLADRLATGVVAASLSIGLWDLARLYAGKISGSFVIWKVGPSFSIIGLVRGGHLCRICHFWPDAAELRSDPVTVGRECACLIRSMTLEECGLPVILYPVQESIPVTDLVVPGFELRDPPQIDNLDVAWHEAWALALHEPTHLDFTGAESVATSRILSTHRFRALTVLRGCAVCLTLAVFLVAALWATNTIGTRMMNRSLLPVREMLQELQQVERDNARKTALLAAGARFLERESVCTGLLNALPDIFGEGVWAEQIVLGEIAAHGWELSVVAGTLSTAGIATLVNALESIQGVTQVRMLYSEQMTIGEKQRQTAVRFKVTAHWSDL